MHNFKTKPMRKTTSERGKAISRGRRRAKRARSAAKALKLTLVVVMVIGAIISAINGLGSDLQQTISTIHAEPVVAYEPKALSDYKDELKVKLSKHFDETEVQARLARVDWAWSWAGERGWSQNDRILLFRVIECESKWDNEADHTNYHPQSNGTTLATMDRGIAMWNDHWHPEVSNTCAYDWQCAINEMISVAQRDGNFGQWACYTLVK